METWQLFLTHFSLSVIFFYILNWIGRHSVSLGYIQLSIFVKDDEAPAFNFLLRTFSPTVFIIVISTLFYSASLDLLVENIWLVVVYYVVFRVLYNLILGRALLLNWGMQFAQWIISIPLAYFAYTNIISKKVNLLPDFNTVSNELWLIIILYIYTVMNNIKTSDEGTRRRKSKYLRTEYSKYKKLYSETIEGLAKNKDVENIVYAILIYENFARPKALRLLEGFIPSKFEITRGIMQIRTKEKITDSESVERAIDKINNDYDQARKDAISYVSSFPGYGRGENEEMPEERYADMIEHQTLMKTVAKYNKDDDYISEVMELFRTLPSIL